MAEQVGIPAGIVGLAAVIGRALDVYWAAGYVLIVVVSLLTVAGVRLQHRVDEGLKPRVSVHLDGQMTLDLDGKPVPDFWLDVVNESQQAIGNVVLVIDALTSAVGTYGLKLWVMARFHERVSRSSAPVTLGPGEKKRWSLLTEGEVASMDKLGSTSGLILCADAGPNAPLPLPTHSEHGKYAMRVAVRADNLQPIPAHGISVEFWKEPRPNLMDWNIGVVKCVEAKPDARPVLDTASSPPG